jgi:hypothetical protein
MGARTLRLMVLSAAASFALAWAWVALVPMAFMESEYAAFRAKRTLLDRCELGEVLVLGDSRAAADIMPLGLPIRATNLAIGGGEPIEALSLLRRALACRKPPSLVILSFDPSHFMHADMFWERSVRFGLLSPADIADLRSASATTGDWSVYEMRHTDGLPSRLRDWLALARFPPYSAGSLLHGGLVMRWPHNRAVLADTLASRGHYFFGTEEGSSAVAIDGHLDRFVPLPVLGHYFERLLALLEAHGIESRFIGMPVNEATWNASSPAMRTGFAAWLAGFERRHPSFHVDGDLMPHWPDRFFGDVFCHLNPEGAERLTAELGQRLQAAPPRTQNDAQNGWFSGTAPDASHSVAPSSKRGS